MLQSVDTSVRERILEQALRLFAERGVSGTSLSLVAQAAGISKPTLVYHFGSKEGLRSAVLTELMEHWQAEVPRLMVAAASGGPRLDSLLNAFFEYFQSDRNRARVLVREMLDRPVEMRRLLALHLQPWTRLMTEAIRLGQGSGLLRPQADPESYTVLIICSALSLVAVGPDASALISPEPSLAAQRVELVRIARTALLNPPPQES
jgi:TetR/AcrR family transcriptional regulator